MLENNILLSKNLFTGILNEDKWSELATVFIEKSQKEQWKWRP